MKLFNAKNCFNVLLLAIFSAGSLQADEMKVIGAWYGIEGGKIEGIGIAENAYKGKPIAEIIQLKMVKGDKIVMPAEPFHHMFGDPVPHKLKLVAIALKRSDKEVHLRISETADKSFEWVWGDTEKFDPTLAKNKGGIIGGDDYLKAYSKKIVEEKPVAVTDAKSAIVVPPPPPAAKVEVVVAKVDPESHPVMEAKKEDPSAWRLVEPAKDAKPVEAVPMDKGTGNDGLIIKMVSVCDQNNIWCVANDGKKDAVYQLRSKGLVHSFDGVYVSAGKGIVTAINDKHEVFELKGGTGDAWEKVEGLKLSKVSRPSPNEAWGLLETGKGAFAVFMYDEDSKKWVKVKNIQGQDAKGITDLSVNAEGIVLALTDKNELLMRDLDRENLYEQAKAVMKEPKKGKKDKKEKPGKGKEHKKDKSGEGKKDKPEKESKKDKPDKDRKPKKDKPGKEHKKDKPGKKQKQSKPGKDKDDDHDDDGDDKK